MAFARFEIEQVEPHRWKAELEAGFPVCRRKLVFAPTFDDILAETRAAYYEMVPAARPAVDDVIAEVAHKVAQEALVRDDAVADAGEGEAPDMPDDRAALIAKAEALGIPVDRRWGETRLAVEIAKAEDTTVRI